jgi:hypothetical protein
MNPDTPKPSEDHNDPKKPKRHTAESPSRPKMDHEHYVGPDEFCNCPVCIFSKSQAPGNPYDLEQCPRYRASIRKKAPSSRKMNPSNTSKESPDKSS